MAVGLPRVEVAVDAVFGDLGGDLGVFLFLQLLAKGIEVGAELRERARGEKDAFAVGKPAGGRDGKRELEDFFGFAAVGAEDVERGGFVGAAFGGEGEAVAIGGPLRSGVGAVGGGERAGGGAGGGVEEPEVGDGGVFGEIVVLSLTRFCMCRVTSKSASSR